MTTLTIFVIETGEPSLSQCVTKLREQSYSNFELKTISNTYPMWKAFQRMLDECTADYFVQVDADMLLNPFAIGQLVDRIQQQPRNIAISVAWLWDNDVERQILGVKIYRHDICVKFPYKDSVSCEMGQVKDMEKHGYKVDVMPMPDSETSCAGLHFPSQNPEMAFRRWERNMIKMRKLPWMTWLGQYPKKLLEKFVSDPTNEIAKAKVFGAMSGLSQQNIEDSEADFRIANQNYRRFSALMGEDSHGPREMTLYLTDKCNFRCVFDGNPCMRETDTGTPDSGVITIETLEDILKMHPSIKGCCIAGYGEPLLHPKLIDLLDLFGKYNVYVGIITNGALIESRLEATKHKSISYISVSLNAHTPEGHQAYSQTKTWDKVLSGIKTLKSLGINVGVSCVITRHNLKIIPDYLELCKDLDVCFVNFLNLLPHDGVENLNFQASVITEDCLEEMLLLEVYKAHPYAHLVKTWPMPITNQNPYKCKSPLISMGVDAEGSVSFCRRIDPPEKKNGNFRDNNVWFSPSRISLLMNVVGDQKTHGTCQGCFGNWKE